MPQQVVDDEGRPHQRLEDAQDHGPEAVGVLDVVDQRTDKAQTVDRISAAGAAVPPSSLRHGCSPFTRMTSRSRGSASGHRAGWTCRAGPSARTMIVELVAGGGQAGRHAPVPLPYFALVRLASETQDARVPIQARDTTRLGS